MTRRGHRLVAAIVAATALASPAAPAVAQHRTDGPVLQQKVTLDRHRSVAIHGLGFGHGHGLSQYGAEGMAQHGWTGARILGYYYPHTATGYYRSSVAVKISADTDGNTTVVDQPGLVIHDLATGEQWPTPTEGPGWGAGEWRMGTAPLGGTLVSYLSDTWHVWKKLAGDAEFLRADGLTLDGDNGLVPYSGALQSRIYNGHRITVDVVDLESYVRSVVPSEMPSGWHQAALETRTRRDHAPGASGSRDVGRAVLGTSLKLAAVVLTAGAVVLSADPGSRAESRPTSATTPARATSYADIVALGDSYSAGPLIPAQRPDPANCLRSTNNYPAFLAGYLAVGTYRDVTCSGARVRDFTHTQTTVIPGAYNPPPQLGALSADTDLVTVGIGGNDFGLFGSLTSKCPELAPTDPNGAPCKRYFTTKTGVNKKYRDAKRIQAHVGRGLREIHHDAPNATIVLVGYPRLLPASGTCAAIPFAAGDYPFARHLQYLLNRSLRRAAARHHATYVSTYGVSRGHDACAGDKAWINGPQNTALAAAYHPFEKGERGIGRAVYHHLTGMRAPKGGDAAPPLGSVILNPPPVG